MICKNCKYWKKEDTHQNYHADEIIEPYDPDTYQPMENLPFEVRICLCPEIVYFERQPTDKGVALIDGSNYYARMLTAENFGCVNFEEGGE